MDNILFYTGLTVSMAASIALLCFSIKQSRTKAQIIRRMAGSLPSPTLVLSHCSDCWNNNCNSRTEHLKKSVYPPSDILQNNLRNKEI